MRQVCYFPANPAGMSEAAGISIAYSHRDRRVSISGWYDRMVGIAGETLPLWDLLGRLGITDADIAQARAEAPKG